MLLIKNGYMIDPKSGWDGNYDLLIEKDTIVRIGKKLEAPDGKCRVIDAEGLLVAPGLVDVHVHFREPGFTEKEDIVTGAAAAARGGYTSVVLMANTKPPVDNLETLKYVQKRGGETGIHVYTCANVTRAMQGKELTPMRELAEAGAVGFTDDGISLTDEEIVRNAMRNAAALDMPVSLHEEDPKLIANNGINKGRASEHFGIGGSPREAEITMVERDLKLALETGASVNIQHVSTRETVELIRRAKEKGKNIHAEATPHTAEEKAKPITEAPSGIIGLETALALGITELVDGGYLTMRQLLALMSTNPANLYHLNAGYLAEGGPADVILIDTRLEWTPMEYASKASNTPFTGRPLKGKVVATICGERDDKRKHRKAGLRQ